MRVFLGHWTLALALVALVATGCSDDGGTSSDSTAGRADGGSATDAAGATDGGGSGGDAAAPFAAPKIWGPKALTDKNPDPNIVEVDITAGATKLTVEGHTLDMLGYNGQLPGPLLQAKVGDQIIVHFKNTLTEPTTIHWHGLRISDQMDGNPRIQKPVKPGETFTYRFVAREPGTFWYHPHVRSNVQMEHGLSGSIVIHRREAPEYDAERVLLLDDILINLNTGKLPPFIASHPEIMHGRFGNRLLTNGVQSHKLSVSVDEGTVERWRLINAANARTMELEVKGASFRVIAVDGGPLAKPYTTKRLQMPVGQRYDLEVRYDKPGKAELLIITLARDSSGQIVEQPLTMFSADVKATGKAPRAIAWPKTEPLVPERKPTRTVTYEFKPVATTTGVGVEWQINGQTSPKGPLYTFKKGETVKIRLTNLGGPEHPFHLHGQFFRIVDTGSPWTKQPGLKDTVLVPGMTTVEVIAYFDNPGRWMAHCHILSHAELGMMSELIVEDTK